MDSPTAAEIRTGEFAIEDFSVTDVAGGGGASVWATVPLVPLVEASLAEDDLAREYRFYRVVVSTVTILDEEALGDGLVVRATVVRA